jgi:uncharacterized membrane protein YphA (DoxX/SURF4 family)
MDGAAIPARGQRRGQFFPVMSDALDNAKPISAVDALAVGGRWLLAAVFLYLGLQKALHPVEFLKLVRQFGGIDSPWLLNFVAATLPWFEIVCGVLLVAGVAVRGTALVAFALLGPFTVLVLLRALELRGATGLALCAVKFDCGCGTGEMFACRKLAENAGLLIVSLGLACSTRDRLCWRHTLARRANAG